MEHTPAQLTLFEEPTPKPKRGDKRFLSDTRGWFEFLQQSPTLIAAAKTAAKTTVKAARATSVRSASLSFETSLVSQLLDPATAAAVSAETVALAGGKIAGVAFEEGTGLADLLVIWDIPNRDPFTVAVNVKKAGPGTSRTEGCSLTQFVSLATNPEFDVRQPPASVSIPTWRWVLEWCARVRKIQPRTDYYLLVGAVDNGKLLGLAFQGVLSSMKGDRSVIRKHANKDTVVIVMDDTKQLGEEDINALVSRELLPKPDLDLLRAMLVSAITEGKDSEEVERVSAALLALSDEELRNWADTLAKP